MIVESLLPKAKKRLLTLKEDAPLTEAAAQLGNSKGNLIVVCNGAGSMVGVVTKTDIVSRISQCQGSGCTMSVAAVMTREVAECRPGDPLEDAWSTMKGKGVLNLPVVDQNHRPLGELAARDVLQSLMGEVEHEEALLRDYVMGVGYR